MKMILTENEKGNFNEKGGFTKSLIVNENYLSWKTDKLVFKETQISDVVSILMKYFGQSIVIKGEGLDSLPFTSSYQDPTMEEILEDIRLVLPVDFQIVNDTIILRPAT